jgi:hypothetical protein
VRNAAARLVMMLDPETAERRKDEAAKAARREHELVRRDRQRLLPGDSHWTCLLIGLVAHGVTPVGDIDYSLLRYERRVLRTGLPSGVRKTAMAIAIVAAEPGADVATSNQASTTSNVEVTAAGTHSQL